MSSGISHTNDGDVGFHLKTFGKGMWLLFTVFGNINYHCANINFTKTKTKKKPPDHSTIWEMIVLGI